MGCSGCTKVDGCEAEKGPQRTAIDDIMASVYPDRTWGRPDDERRFGAGVRPREVKRLARALSAATRAPTFYRAGGPDDLCDFVWVLCLGREPALVDVRDGLARPESDRVRERYLRVAFSTVGRVAAVQEVAMELDLDRGDYVIRELPQPGVYDPTLLKRMRAIVDLLEASDLEHLDFGMVDKPYPEAQPGEYVERFGVEPAIVNFLFYAQPARTSSVTVLSEAARPA
ncbi:MAG TPA: hypothetical protein VFF06_14770 [Polyangia bacterium]|nr:hypothetical protein [Polyangia bacterium]